MRIMARLLIKLRQKKKEFKHFTFTNFLSPRYFDLIVEATKELTGYKFKNDDGERLPVFETPSLALKIGYGLDHLLMLLHGIGIGASKDEMVQASISMQKLYKHEWPVLISSASLRTLGDNAFTKKEIMPLTTDLLKVKDFCSKRTDELCSILKNKVSLEIWRELAETIITRLTIFNKRRGNKPSSLLLKKYIGRDENLKTVHHDIVSTLSPLEQQLMDR